MFRQVLIIAPRRLFESRLLPSRLGLALILLLIGLQFVSWIPRLVTRIEVIDGVPQGMSALSPVFTPEVRHWSPLIYAWAAAYHVDPNLIATVIQIESCGDPTAISRSGAQGLFQVMPFHFTQNENMTEVLTNGRRGMEYLARGLEIANGDPGLALAGYNGGHGVIKRGWAKWSAETRRYYQWGTGIYADALKGLESSPSVESWLKAGGASLCKRASVNQLVAVN